MNFDLLYKTVTPRLTVNDGERSVVSVISAACMDRDREVLLSKGCDASEYMKNPVVLMEHCRRTFPLGKCVGIERTDDEVIAKTVFATRPPDHPEGQEWLPDTVFSLFQQGVMRAFSVGFMPTEERQPTKKDMERFGSECRCVYSKWKMFEYSVCVLGANQDALSLAVSKGLLTPARVKAWFPPAPEAPEAAPEVAPEVPAEAAVAPVAAAEPVPVAPVAAPLPKTIKRVQILIPGGPAAVPAKALSITDLVAQEMARQTARRKGQLFY